MNAWYEATIDDIRDDIVDRVVDALHHTREDKARFDHVLIRVHTDYKMRRAVILFALLLDGIERSQSGVACGGEDHVRTFADLGQRELFAFTRVVPCTVSYTDVILDHADVGINRLGAFFITFGEAMNQADIHAAEKTDRARV